MLVRWSEAILPGQLVVLPIDALVRVPSSCKFGTCLGLILAILVQGAEALARSHSNVVSVEWLTATSLGTAFAQYRAILHGPCTSMGYWHSRFCSELRCSS